MPRKDEGQKGKTPGVLCTELNEKLAKVLGCMTEWSEQELPEYKKIFARHPNVRSIYVRKDNPANLEGRKRIKVLFQGKYTRCYLVENLDSYNNVEKRYFTVKVLKQPKQ